MKVTEEIKVTAKDVGALLHGIHQHDIETEKIIYFEEDLLPILKVLGLPDPVWGQSMSLKEWKKKRPLI